MRTGPTAPKLVAAMTRDTVSPQPTPRVPPGRRWVLMNWAPPRPSRAFSADRERVKVVRVQVDRDQAGPARPVQHPADRGPGHRQPLGDLVLGQLVLVVVPGHPEEQFLAHM